MFALINFLISSVLALIALVVIIPLGILSPILLAVGTILAMAILPILIVVLAVVTLFKLLFK